MSNPNPTHGSHRGNQPYGADLHPQPPVAANAVTAPTPSPKASAPSGPVWRTLTVTALNQGKDPRDRSTTAARRLIDILNLSDYAVMIRIGGHDGHLSMEAGVCIDAGFSDRDDRFDGQTGNGHPGSDARRAFPWRKDLTYALSPILTLADEPTIPPLPMRVADAYELRLPLPSESDRSNGRMPTHEPGDEESILDYAEQPIDEPLAFTNGSEGPYDFNHSISPIPLYEELAASDNSIVYLLERANANERNIANALYDPSGGLAFCSFLPNTPPMRFRTLITSPTRVSKGVLSEFKELTGAVLTRVGATEMNRLSTPDPSSLRGYVIPGVVAGVYLRLPVAEEKPFPGMATVPAERKDRPLDPMPRPAADRPIRLGTATLGDGSMTSMALEPTDLATHMQVIGAPGSGKTTFLVNLARELARQGIGFACFSTHRDLMDRVLESAAVPDGYTMLGVDHADTRHVMGVNPLAARDDDEFAMVSAETVAALGDYVDPTNQGFFGERASSAFTLIAEAWRSLMPIVTIPMVTSVLTRRDLCDKLAGKLRSRDEQQARWVHESLCSMSGSDSGELFSWLGSRFNVMHSSPLLMRTLGSISRDPLDLVQLMDAPGGTGLAVNLAGDAMGTSASQFLLASWLIRIRHAMLRRRHPERPFVVMVDEAHAAAFGPLAAMLDQARKFGVCIVVAHQRMGQLNAQLANALEADAGSFVALRTGLADAARAGIRLGGWNVEDLMHMPTFDAAATIQRGGMPTCAFTLHVARPADETEQDRKRLRDRLAASTAELCDESLCDKPFFPSPTTISRIIDWVDAPIQADRDAKGGTGTAVKA